jgi:phosphoglycolate phosphatase-like HAD superfamily hydrolase
MSAPQNIIAVIFDFDDTLTDDSTTRLLEAHKIDPTDFWQNRMVKLVSAGWDPTLAYLKLILDDVGEGKPFAHVSNEALRAFGATLAFYQGIPEVFGDLQRLVGEHHASRPAIEFYIISGGLEEIIRGSKIASHFTGIWGCRFAEEGGRIRHIMNTVSFTEKTKYLYAINKGLIEEKDIRSHPYSVNEHVDDSDRRVPFETMIYIGDGMTDVPCFSLLTKTYRGKAFGVFDPLKEGSPKKAWEKLVAPKRVTTMNSPRYGKGDDLGALLRMAVKEICLKMDGRTRAPLS